MLTQNRGIWTYLNYLDPFLLQAAVFLSLFDLLWFVGAQHLEVQMAQAAGAKSIIVFDEKMSKAPLEQQNKSGTLSGQDRHWLFGFGALQHVLRCLWCWRCFCSLWQNTQTSQTAGKNGFPRSGFKATSNGKFGSRKNPQGLAAWSARTSRPTRLGNRPGMSLASDHTARPVSMT